VKHDESRPSRAPRILLTYVELHRYFFIEERLQGTYVKYNSNAGYVDPRYREKQLSDDGKLKVAPACCLLQTLRSQCGC
jgi:hypothetical protein